MWSTGIFGNDFITHWRLSEDRVRSSWWISWQKGPLSRFHQRSKSDSRESRSYLAAALQVMRSSVPWSLRKNLILGICTTIAAKQLSERGGWVWDFISVFKLGLFKKFSTGKYYWILFSSVLSTNMLDKTRKTYLLLFLPWFSWLKNNCISCQRIGTYNYLIGGSKLYPLPMIKGRKLLPVLPPILCRFTRKAWGCPWPYRAYTKLTSRAKRRSFCLQRTSLQMILLAQKTRLLLN